MTKKASHDGGVNWGLLWWWFSIVSAMGNDDKAAGGRGQGRQYENVNFEL